MHASLSRDNMKPFFISSFFFALILPLLISSPLSAETQETVVDNSTMKLSSVSSKGSNESTPQTAQGPQAKFKITNFRNQCIKDLSYEPKAAGDFQNISFGPTVAAKVLTYDLASKKAGFNTGIGAGFSMRLYSDVKLARGVDDTRDEKTYGISQIRKQCRGETFDGAWLETDNQMIIPWMSITPIVYASQTERADEVSIQPAISVGFLGELVNIGTGFNLSGPNKGHVFLLLSLGYGFRF